MLRGRSHRGAKYRAHLPAMQIPNHVFFHSMLDDCGLTSVTVSTDSKVKAKVSPLVSMTPPDCITESQRKYYENAVQMAQRGNSLVCVLKNSGVHQSTLYSCPVFRNRDSIVGVLIAVEDSAVEDSPSPTASSMSSQEKDMLDTLCLNSMSTVN